MPTPSACQRASPAFHKFLVDAREASGPTIRSQIVTMVRGVLPAAHNSAPDSCIRDVAIGSRKKLGEAELHRVPAILPAGAMQFWRP